LEGKTLEPLKRILKCSEETAVRVARSIPYRYELLGPDRVHLPIEEIPVARQLITRLTESRVRRKNRAMLRVMRWQIKSLCHRRSIENTRVGAVARG